MRSPVPGWVKPNVLACKGLTRKRLEHVAQEGVVFAPRRAFHSHIAPINRVAKQRVADVLHVHPDLVGPARLQLALHQRHGAQALEHPVMGDGVLALSAIHEHLLHPTVAQASAHTCPVTVPSSNTSPHTSAQ